MSKRSLVKDPIVMWGLKVLVPQWCLTLCDPVDCSPPGSSVHGILQARILEWVAIPFSRGFSWPRDQTHISCLGRQILYHRATWEATYLVMQFRHSLPILWPSHWKWWFLRSFSATIWYNPVSKTVPPRSLEYFVQVETVTPQNYERK